MEVEPVSFIKLEDAGITAAKGYRAAGLHCGIKFKRPDLGLLVSDTPAQAAGVFTTNQVKAACVEVNQQLLSERRKVRALVVNSGNANACNGPQGLDDTHEMQSITGRRLGIEPHEVLVASTGVIGVPLPMSKIQQGIERACRELDTTGAHAFSEAILTTDLVTKECAVQLQLDGCTITIGGVAKGSGMIHPNMATMLAFLATDASVEDGVLQPLIQDIVDRTFNMISVDGDTSTNDMVLVLANGQADNPPLAPGRPGWQEFYQAVHFVSLELAKMIARDGEGATKLIQVTVSGAVDEAAARLAARTVTRSPLVKTAVYGADANWGRILCAVGYSGITFDPSKTKISLGPIEVYRGRGLEFDESAARDYLLQDTIEIHIDLQSGQAAATAYGCDLTEDYIKINASYRS